MVDYADDPTVFGRILEGSLPALALLESESLLAFQDRTPRAPLHALVIPKQNIPTVNSLEYSDLPLLNDARTMAMALIEHYFPQAHKDGDYILAYHVPPFNSVDHLHLHVLAPASEMGWIFRYGKYQVGTCWCTDEATERQRLEKQRHYSS